MTNWANIEKLGQYESYCPVFPYWPNFFLPIFFLYWATFSIFAEFVIKMDGIMRFYPVLRHFPRISVTLRGWKPCMDLAI